MLGLMREEGLEAGTPVTWTDTKLDLGKEWAVGEVCPCPQGSRGPLEREKKISRWVGWEEGS